MDKSVNDNPSNNGRVLGKTSNAFMAAFSFAVLFVALMLFVGKTITVNNLGIPAIALFVFVSLVEMITKKDGHAPRWVVIGSFSISVVTAVVMTVLQ